MSGETECEQLPGTESLIDSDKLLGSKSGGK